MSRMPGTTWVGEQSPRTPMSAYDIVCIHTIVGYAVEGTFVDWPTSLRGFGKALLFVLALYPVRQLFVQSLGDAEIEPVMAYLLITATLAIVANIVADIVYAAVDPRIRLDA